MAYDTLTTAQLLDETLDRANQLENMAQAVMRRVKELKARGASPAPTPTAPVYASILGSNGLAPSETTFSGRKWRVNACSEATPGLDYCLRLGGEWARFEVRPDDPPVGDNPTKRRSELSGSIYGDKTRLPNGVLLKGGFKTIHRAWAKDMTGTYGFVGGQIHMGSPGGSPALAFRRYENGDYRITTRSEFEPSSVERWCGTMSFDEPHAIDYELVLHEINGLLRVRIDGELVVDFTGGIGHSAADHYWAVGIYAAGGVTCPVVAEYGAMRYPTSPAG